jgi:hypothetical protein
LLGKILGADDSMILQILGINTKLSTVDTDCYKSILLSVSVVSHLAWVKASIDLSRTSSLNSNPVFDIIGKRLRESFWVSFVRWAKCLSKCIKEDCVARLPVAAIRPSEVMFLLNSELSASLLSY